MHGWRLIVLISLLGIGLAPQQPQVVISISASAPLGSTTTATLVLNNQGNPATTVQLYEAWPSAAKNPFGFNQPLRVPLPPIDGRIDPQLQDQFRRAPDTQSEMLVYLADQADLSAAAAVLDWNARGEAVYNTLRQHALLSQADLLSQLTAQGYQPRSLWIVNAIVVHGNGALASWLAARPEVALVAANQRHQLEASPAPATAASGATMAWGVAKINAPQVWADWGVRGEGIVIANIDTGVYFTHTALLHGYRGWSATGISHDYNWYDPTDQPFGLPNDKNGHGTHTMGTLAGRTEGITTTIGVAPGARWIAARGCATSFCSDTDLIDSAQWMLAPTKLDGSAARPDLRPHIINNSWGESGERQWYIGYVEAWNAAGILSVFANGNYGRFGCRTAITPASYPNAFAVGATDSDDEIADFSSRGPAFNNQIKPDLSAPGVAVESAWINGALEYLQGTSMAAPHVAGAAALLWSVNPNLIGDLATTRQILTGTTVPRYSSQCGDGATARPNNVYGWGRLDVYAAVKVARVDVPWMSMPQSVTLAANSAQTTINISLDGRQVIAPGTYTARILLVRSGITTSVPVQFTVTAAPNTALFSGKLVDHWTGRGVYGRVNFSGGPQVQADSTGIYTLTLPYGTYPLTATATGYVAQNSSINIPTQTTSVITLMANLPHVLASAPTLSATLDFGAQARFPITISNDGPQPLSITPAVPPLEWSSEDSLSGGPAAPLYDLSPFASLPLADDQIFTDALNLGFTIPIYGTLASQIYVSSNGWITINQRRGAAPGANCLPSQSLPAGSLAPFWADLDPSQGGAIRAGRVLSDTFVVSYEAVPLWQEPAITTTIAPTFTFQISLHSDGRVQYRYGRMDTLPGRWGVGTGDDALRGQSLACNRQPQSLSGRTWTLRNQATASLWLQVPPQTLTIAPNTSTTLQATLIGLGYTPWREHYAEGELRLNTNDPHQPTITLPAMVKVGAPPYQVALPIFAYNTHLSGN